MCSFVYASDVELKEKLDGGLVDFYKQNQFYLCLEHLKNVTVLLSKIFSRVFAEWHGFSSKLERSIRKTMITEEKV